MQTSVISKSPRYSEWPLSFEAGLRCCSLVFALLACVSVAKAEPDTLVFTRKSWDGEFATHDIPGGVESTASTESIWSVHADGTNLKQLVLIPDKVCAVPTYSPDGQWLYFQSNASGTYQLYRCKADGSSQEQLTSAVRPGPPWTSVYGLQMTKSGNLLCVAYDGMRGCVAVFSPDASEMKLVAPHLGYLYMSAMSPHGDSVVAAGPANGYRMWLLKLPDAFRTDGSKLQGPTVDLVPEHPQAMVPQFAPDGHTIVYIRGDGDIYSVQSDGSGKRRLTEGNNYHSLMLSPSDKHGSRDPPHVSPDGQRIAYIARRDGIPNVFVMNIDGSNPRQLTTRKSACARVRWSPDGKSIAFVSFEGGKYLQLFVISAEGGNPKQLTEFDGAVYSVPVWKPHPLNTERQL